MWRRFHTPSGGDYSQAESILRPAMQLRWMILDLWSHENSEHQIRPLTFATNLNQLAPWTSLACKVAVTFVASMWIQNGNQSFGISKCVHTVCAAPGSDKPLNFPCSSRNPIAFTLLKVPIGFQKLYRATTCICRRHEAILAVDGVEEHKVWPPERIDFRRWTNVPWNSRLQHETLQLQDPNVVVQSPFYVEPMLGGNVLFPWESRIRFPFQWAQHLACSCARGGLE